MSELKLPMNNEIILRDCPWRYQQWSMADEAQPGEKWGRGTGCSPYTVITTQRIADLPMERIAAKDCVLLDWVTFPLMEAAIRATTHRTDAKVKPIWSYKAVGFVWIKTTPKAADNLKRLWYKGASGPLPEHFMQDIMRWIRGERSNGIPGLWHFGNGFWTRGNVECCLIYTRGKGTTFRIAKDVSQLIIAPVGAHSAKPQQQYTLIDQLLGKDRPRIELFARQSNPPPPHWRATGLEYDGLDIFDALGGP